MTGADVKTKLESYLDEVGSGYFDDNTLNDLFFKAETNLVKRLVDNYGLTNEITREMQPLVLKTGLLTPTSATLDISNTSSTIPNWYSLILLSVISPYNGSSISRVAIEKPYDQFNSNYTVGTARYPRYWYSSGLLHLEPSNATGAVMTYFRTAIQINVADSSTQLSYNDEYLMLLISDVMALIGFAGRDTFISQAPAFDKNIEKT